MQFSESIIEIAKALSAFQGEIEQPEKSADNPFFKSKYVPLNKVIAAFKKCGPKHGLSFVQYPVNSERGIGVETLLMHSSGEWIRFEPYYLPLDKSTAQGAGSGITYAKRYALSAALGIDSGEDDDGNQASDQHSKGKQGRGKQESQKVDEIRSSKINNLVSEFAQLSKKTNTQVVAVLKKQLNIKTSFKDIDVGVADAIIVCLEKWIEGRKSA